MIDLTQSFTAGVSESVRLLLVETAVSIGQRTYQIQAVEDQDGLFRNVRTDEELQHFPYGLLLWHAAVGLARRIAANPDIVAGKPVLEIGAGVGLVGLVAQHCGGMVTQTEYLPEALTLCRWNAQANAAPEINIRPGDWRSWPDELTCFPVVLGSDIFYERSLHDTLAELLPRLVASDGTLLISDPVRPQALDFIARLERSKQWQIQIDSDRVPFRDQIAEIAYFTLRPQ